MFNKLINLIANVYVRLRYGSRVSLSWNDEVAGVRFRFNSKTSRVHVGTNFRGRSYIILNLSDSGVLEIGSQVFFNDGVHVNVREHVSIGNGCLLGQNVQIYDHDHDLHGADMRNSFVSAPVVIGDNTWIGSNVTILKGVTIGSNCVVAAGTVVTKDIPDGFLLRNNLDQCASPIRGDEKAER